MGLDITVRKILKERPKDKKNKDYFRMLDEEGNGTYDRLGFPEWTKQYEQEVEETWYDWEKYKEQTGFDIDQWAVSMECVGKDGYMEVRPIECVPPDYDEEHPEKYEEFWENVELKRIYWKDVPTKKVKIKVLFWKEIGYQRKGLNGKFYKDYEDGRIGYYVWSKKELERYRKDYCDRKHKAEWCGDKITIDPKRSFKENIIDNFTEGEDVVTFSW